MEPSASMPAAEHSTVAEQSRRVSGRIDWAVLHLWGAMLGIGLQPISTATGNIGFGIAVATTLPRVAALLPEWRTLLRQGWVRCLIAWLAWSWLTLLWSPDVAFGVTQFRATRVLLWIPVLWPLRTHWSHLVAAILIGTTIMGVIQALQLTVKWPLSSKFTPGVGFTTPTQTGLWAAVGLSFWLILAVAARFRETLAVLPLAMLGGVSLVWSATRSSVIGLAVELVVANLVLALSSPGWIKRAALRGLIGIAILGAAMLFAHSALERKFQQALKETTAAIDTDAPATPEVRLAMWKMSLKGWQRQPLFGHGIGAIPSIARDTDVRSPVKDMRTVTMIHSTYIQILTETGVIGLGLFAAFMTLLFRDVLRSVWERPMLVASFGALVVWFVAAAFDGYQQSGGFLSVGAILMPLALAAPATDRSTA